MYVCKTAYNTPLGQKFAHTYGATPEEARAKASKREMFGLVEIMFDDMHWLSGDEGTDESAEERSDEPPCPRTEVFRPEVVSSGEDDECNGDIYASFTAGLSDSQAWHDLNAERVKDEFLLIIGKRDETKVRKFGEHRLLISGPFKALTVESRLDVSDLARVLSDLPEVRGEVRGN